MVRHLVQDGQVLHATLLREYVWMDGRAVAVIEGGEVFFVRTDHIGRPVFATNDLGLKVWEASYLPFGGVHVSTGAITLRFPGQWFQSESGLHQNWMRDYDPTTGRYIQADPLGLVDGASVYGYALQNPLLYTDPTGEFVPLVATLGRGLVSCLANPACRAGAAGAAMMLYGWLTDEDCYTLEEAFWDFAIGASIAAPHWWFNPGRNVRGGGVRIWRDGPGIEWHRFGIGPRGSKTIVNRPHFHAGTTRNQMRKHRPWQGGWGWW